MAKVDALVLGDLLKAGSTSFVAHAQDEDQRQVGSFDVRHDPADPDLRWFMTGMTGDVTSLKVGARLQLRAATDLPSITGPITVTVSQEWIA